MHLTHFLWSLFVLVPAIIGRRLVQKRWSRNPEVCALVTWACGLFVSAALARASMLSGVSLFEEIRSWNGLTRLCLDGATAVAIWLLIRAALLALDFRPPETERLSES